MSAPTWVTAHLRSGERVRWWGRPSRWGLFPIAASTLAALAAAVFGLRFESGGAVPVYTLPGVIALAGLASTFARRVIALRFTGYVITEDRFYAVTSFFTTRVQSVPLARLSRVSLVQGAIHGLFGLWTARVTAYGDAGVTLVIPAMRDGAGLLAHASDGLRRGANAAWLLKGD